MICVRCGSARHSTLAAIAPCSFCGAGPEYAREAPEEPADRDLGRKRCVTVRREGRAA